MVWTLNVPTALPCQAPLRFIGQRARLARARPVVAGGHTPYPMVRKGMCEVPVLSPFPALAPTHRVLAAGLDARAPDEAIRPHQHDQVEEIDQLRSRHIDALDQNHTP